MSFSNDIIKTALLGTQKMTPTPNSALEQFYAKIKSDDKEDFFYKLAFATLMYEEAGQQTIEIKDQFPICPEETKKCISDNAASLVKTFLSTEEDALLNFCMYRIVNRELLVPPELVSLILNEALQNKKQAPIYLQSCGQVGRWLCMLNEDWQKLTTQQEVDNWELGSIETRVTHLKNIRKENPDKVLVYITQNFSVENANNRLLLLQTLADGLSIDDVDFLMQLQKDKSQKVKDAATEMLIRIEGSTMNAFFCKTLSSILEIKEERHLLVSKRKKISIQNNVAIDEEIFKLGIQKVSSIKGIPDNLFIAFQIIGLLHPTQLCKLYGVSDLEFLEMLITFKEFEALQNYIVQTVIKAKNQLWASLLIKKCKDPSIDLLQIIPKNEQATYFGYYEQDQIIILADYLMNENYEVIPTDNAKSILQFLINQPYQNTNDFYKNLAIYLPEAILPNLCEIANLESDHYQQKYLKEKAIDMIRVIEFKNNIKLQIP
jgi:peroxiredoxin family protein